MVGEGLDSESGVRAGRPGSGGWPVPAPHAFSVRYSSADHPGYWHEVVVLGNSRTGVLLGRCTDTESADQCRSAARGALVTRHIELPELPEGSTCVELHPCVAGYQGEGDDCLAPASERAWSSPIYLERG